MDPTLAPGYVPPNGADKKGVAKGHHWAEIQKERDAARESGNSSTNESDSSAKERRPSMNRPVTSDGPGSRNPRLAYSRRGGRSTLSDGEGIGGPADLEEVPIGVKRQALRPEDYAFPDHRLRAVMDDDSKIPLVIVACGSFSPITYLHLRLFEMAADAVNESTNYEIVGGFFSPVSDSYRKPGLVAGRHRVRMCELACERTSNWLMVDAWEVLQPDYTPTAQVLDHFEEEINIKRKGIKTRGANGERKKCKIMLLAGGDLITSFGEPGVWAEDDLQHILGKYGCLIVERTGSDVWGFLLSHDVLYQNRKNILVIKQLIYNDISSTKVRLFVRRGMSVKYLLPNSVIKYIEIHGLYLIPEPVKSVLGDNGA